MKDYSNYHGTNSSEKITHDGLLLLEKSLNGFEGQDVLINSTVNSKVLIYQRWDANSEVKKVIGRIEDIDRGNLFRIGELDWLVTTIPEDNKIYRKAEMRLCNSTFPIQSDKTQVLLTDENGNPILNDFGEEQYEWTYITEEVPCIVESKVVSDYTNEAINLPEGRLDVTIPHRDGENVAIGKEFSMYGAVYQIGEIDYTKSMNGAGILVLKGKKV